MQRFQGVGSYGTVGLDFVLAVVLGFFGGRWLDQKLGTNGWFAVAGFVLGVAAGFNNLFKAAKRMRQEMEREDQQRAQRQRTETDDEHDPHRTRPGAGPRDGA